MRTIHYRNNSTRERRRQSYEFELFDIFLVGVALFGIGFFIYYLMLLF